MDETKQLLADPAIDQLLRNLAVSRKKWPELMGEIFELSSGTSVAEAKKALVQAGWNILQYETKPNGDSLSIDEGDIRRSLEFIRKKKTSSPVRERSAQHQFGRLLRLLFRKLSEEEDLDLLAQLSYLPFMSGFDTDKGAMDQVLEDLAAYAQVAVQEGQFTHFLILIKLILTIMENPGQLALYKTPTDGLDLAGLSQCSALSLGDFKTISDQMSKAEQMRMFESFPHPFAHTGNITRCSRVEIAGKAAGMLSGFSLTNYGFSLVYYEVTVKLKDNKIKNLRLGWGRPGMVIGGYQSLGAAEDSWVLDVQTSRFLHNCGMIHAPEIEKAAEDIIILDLDDTLMGNLFDEDVDQTVEAPSDAAEGATKEPTAALTSPADATVDPLKGFGQTLQGQEDGQQMAIANNMVLSCLLDLGSGRLSFYCNGIFIGHAPVCINADTLRSRAIVPVFSIGTAQSLEINTGSASFKHLKAVTRHLTIASFLWQATEPDILLTNISTSMSSQTSSSSCLQLYQDDATAGTRRPGWLLLHGVSSDPIKSCTIELCLFIQHMSAEGSLQEYNLLSCGPSITAAADSCADDRSCRLTIDAAGCLCFEVSGGEKVKSASNTITFGRWYQLSVAYTFHRSNEKASVQMYINSTSVMQVELTNKSSSKVGKLLPRQVCIGGDARSGWAMKVCDVRLWGTARSSEKISSAYNRSRIYGAEADLLLFLPLEERAGGQVHAVTGTNTNRKIDGIPIEGAFHWSLVGEGEGEMMTLGNIMDSCSSVSAEENVGLEELRNLAESFRGDRRHHMLAQVLTSLLSKFSKSSIKLLQCLQAERSLSSKVLSLLQTTNLSTSVLSPTAPFFMLACSILRQLVASINSNCVSNSLLTLHIATAKTMLNVLKCNIVALLAQPDAWVSKNPDALNKIKMELFVLLICFINGCKHAPPLAADELKKAALSLLCDYLNFFFVSADNRFKLLEIMLQAHCKDINEIKAPQLKRAVSNFKSDADFLYQERIPKEPVRALLSMNSESSMLLVRHLANTLSQRAALQQFVPSSLSPKAANRSAIVRSRSIHVLPFHGAYVRRGPDWCFGDEDGGEGSIGVIIDVTNWKNEPKGGVLVAWRSASVECYRWGVQETVFVDGVPVVKKAYDIEVLTEDVLPLVESGGVEKVVEEQAGATVTKRELAHSPFQVLQDLLGTQNATLTRRTVLQYIKDIAPIDWQVTKRISKAVNVVLKEMSTTQLCSLYQEFYCTFSSKADTTVDALDKYFANFDSVGHHGDLGSKVQFFVDKVMLFVEQCASKSISCEEIFVLLQNVQLLLMTDSFLLASSAGTVCSIFNYRSQEFALHFSANKKKQHWDWKLGQWLPVDPINERPLPAAGGPVRQDAQLLTGLTVDSRSLHNSVQVRKRSQGVDVTWTGHREWTTFMMDKTMSPNSGSYVWYIKFKSMTDKKSHFMAGLCTKKFRGEEFLGQDRESFGISQTFDFFHNGRKHRCVGDAPKVSSGAVLQITLNTDEVSLRFAFVYDDEVYLRTMAGDAVDGLKGKTFMPAFSFFTPGDCVSIMHDTEEMKLIGMRITLHSDEEAKALKSSSAMTGFLGAPGEIASQYVLSFSQLLRKVLRGSWSLNENVERLVGCFLHVLSSLTLWAVPSICCADKLVHELLALLSVLQNQMNDSPADGQGENEQSRLMMICAYNQLSSLLLLNLGKLVKFLVRSDQVVSLNAVLDGSSKSSALRLTNTGQFSKTKQKVLASTKSKLFRHGLRVNHVDNVDVVVSYVNDSDEDLSTLTTWLGLFDRTHRSASKIISGDILNRAVSLAFVGIVYHSGLTSMLMRTRSLLAAYLRANKGDKMAQLRSFKPPAFLCNCWEAAVSLRVWAKDMTATMAIDHIEQMLVEKCMSLIGFEACNDDKVPERMEDDFNIWLSHLHANVRLCEFVEKLTKEVGVAFKLALTENDSIYPIVAVAKEMTQVAVKRRDAFKSIQAILECLSGDLSVGLRCLFLDDVRKVLKGKRLQHFSLQPDAVDMLTELKSADVAWHYLSNLNSASKQQVVEVQAAFNSVVTILCAELSSNSERGSEYQLLLMDALAVRVEESDHELLARVNIFYAIQELLDDYIGSKAPTDDADGNDGKQVVAVAMKLFMLLGLQIATSSETPDTVRLSVDQRSLPHLELKKVKSGPATLNKAVFDIVYALLKDITDVTMPTQSCKAAALIDPVVGAICNKENAVVASEAISLLLCVTKNNECCNILNKPKWLRLLLEVSLFGFGSCRARSLLLLSDLLPIAACNAVPVNIVDVVSGESHCVAQLTTNGEQVVFSLLFLIGDATMCIDGEASCLTTGVSVIEDDCSVAVVAEGIALLRNLLASTNWSSVVLAVLHMVLVDFSSLLQSKEWNSVVGKVTLAAFFVLGGRIHALYKGCPVLFRQSTNEDYSIGIIQNFVDGGSEQAELVGVRLNSAIFTESAGGAQEVRNAVMATQQLQPVDTFRAQSFPLTAELWSDIVSVLNALLHSPLVDEDNLQSRTNSHAFFMHVIEVAAVKSVTNILCDSAVDIGQFGVCMNDNGVLVTLLQRLLEEANKPSVYGGINELPVYEDCLTIILASLRKSLMKSASPEVQSPHLSTDSVVVDSKDEIAPTIEIGDEEPVLHEDHQYPDDNEHEHDVDHDHDEERSEHSDADEMPAELVESLVNMGFSKDVSILALTTCGGDPEEALNYILGNGSVLEELASERASLRQKVSSLKRAAKSAESSKRSVAADTPTLYHYDGDCKKLLALYTEPDVSSERLGCIFPGDDMTVVEERITANNVWFKLLFSDFDDGNYQTSYGDELHEVFVWAPKFVNGVEVVKKGCFDGDADCDLAEPPGESIVVDKYYRIIGNQGATIRVGRETSSSDIATANVGDVVHAFLETFNMDGTVRLQIDYPIVGWISKNLGLVERIEADTEVLERMELKKAADVTEITLEMYEEDVRKTCMKKLLDLDDSVELLTGCESFSKEDRFFGHMQGASYALFAARNNHRRSLSSKPLKLAHFKQQLESSPSSVLSSERYRLCISPMKRLWCRKLALVMILRNLAALKGNQGKNENVHPSMVSLLCEQFMDAQSTEHLADQVILLLRLVLYRGEPNNFYGVETCVCDGMSKFTVKPSLLCVEDVMADVVVAMFQSKIPAMIPLIEAIELRLICLVASNLGLACAQKFSDHSWADTSYADDLDEDLDKHPNVHFVLWVVDLVIKIQSIKGAISVVEYLLLSLKSSSMSLKNVVFKALANLLKFLRTSHGAQSGSKVVIVEVLGKAPIKRLIKFSSRRLWQEMEDTPSYSRFLQSLLGFLSEWRLLAHETGAAAVNLLAAPFHPLASGRTVLRLNSNDSNVKLLPAKDLSGSWTLELWLYRRDAADSEYEMDIGGGAFDRTETASSINSAAVDSKMGFGSLMQLLLGTARKNLAAAKDMSAQPVTADESVAECSETTADEKVITKKGRFLHPLYLLQSSKYYIKLQKGGRVFANDEVEDALQEMDPVQGEAYCLSIGHQGSESEKTFDCIVPVKQWVHLAIAQDANTNIISVFLNGKCVDAQSSGMCLPLHTLGSLKGKMSFCGDIAEMRAWSVVKSESEIYRDLFADVRKQQFLFAHFSFMDSDMLISDDVGCFGACTASGCSVVELDDSERPSLFVESQVDAGSDESTWIELTGMININSVGQRGVLAQGLREIVCLSYPRSQANGSFNGVLEWCARNLKIAVKGVIGDAGVVEFVSNGCVVSGSPDKLRWLSELKFSGAIHRGELQGSMELTVEVETVSPVAAGRIRVDVTTLPAEVRHHVVGGYDQVSVREAAEGQYLAVFQISPHVSSSLGEPGATAVNIDNLPYGVSRNQGSVWLEWRINSTGGNIGFGCCTWDALVHPDASVDANDGTWTYSTSGQASHGANLCICEHADENDVIAMQINTVLGHIRFYKNNEVTVCFDSVHLDRHMDVSTCGEVTHCGIRPFVSLACTGDSVSSLPTRKGPIEILYAEDDDQQRGKFACTLVDGAFTGYGLLGLQKNTSWWFGMWQNDVPQGLHVEIENINADDVVIVAGKHYSVDGDVTHHLTKGDISAADVLSSTEAFVTFRLLRIGILSSIFVGCTASTELSVPTTASSTDDSMALQVNIVGASDESVPYAVASTTLLRTIADSFSLRMNVPTASYSFRLGGVELDLYLSLAAQGVVDQSTIRAHLRTYQTNFSANDDIVQKYFPNSTARYVLQVIYEPGATIRIGVEIEGSAAVHTLAFREAAEAFETAYTSEGIKRYRIGDGWISDRLRGGTEAKVVRILKERLDGSRYRIKREEGIKVRSTASLKSDERGFVPCGTVVTVSERRVVAGDDGEATLISRLLITEPEMYKGWVSDKPHLLEPVNKSEVKTGGDGDPAIMQEQARRTKVRLLRKAKLALIESEKKFTRTAKASGDMKVSTETLFLWKKSRFAEGVRVSPDGKTVSCPDSFSGRYMLLGSKGFSQGVHYWEVQVKAAGWGSVFIGVAPEEGSGWNGFGFINYRATQSFSNETLYGSYFSVNDKVGVLLDMERGTLSFFKDGDDFNVGKVTVVNMGVAYHNLRKHSARYSSSPLLYPCVGVKSAGDELTIHQGHWHTSAGLNSSGLLSDVLGSFELMSSWDGAYEKGLVLDEGTLEQIFEDYQRKGLSTEFFTTSRPGIPVTLNCCPTALRECLGDVVDIHGLCIGCRVITVYGAATILGVKNGRIWYSCERNGQKAWYWLPEELKELLAAGTVHKEATQELSPLLTPLIQPKGQFFPADRIASVDQFCAVVSEMWTRTEDAELVHVINTASHTLDLEPARLTFQQLHAVYKHSDSKMLSRRTIEEINVRFAALCALNAAVSRTLPFIDFNDAERRKKITTIVIDHLDHSHNNSALQNTMRVLYQSLKHAVFTNTKRAFWQLVVDETTISTTAPADEYERPDEIREVSINRIQAHHAAKRKDALPFAERLRLSVFGQLLELLGGWENRALRRSFVHMQDAGQRRAFFVKFIGEGVDDQGGPYRAVFQTAVGEETSESLLGVLEPCANAQADIGENRDKTLLSLSVEGSSSSRIFGHLGRLVGMACRHRILLPLSLADMLWKALVGESLHEDDVQCLDTGLTNSLQMLTSSESNSLDQESTAELLVQALYQSCRSAGSAHSLTMQTCESIVRTTATENVVQLIYFHHLNSQTDALQHFFQGLGQVLPTEILCIFSAKELERVFCGEADVDIALLKKVTVYESVSPEDSHIQYFWAALEAMTSEERAAFINFCSGRSRLPAAASDYPMPFKLSTATGSGNPDSYLPTARTCFFSLAVPKYSSLEVCLAKLRYAVRNTELMDADFIDRRGTAGWDNLT